MRCLLYILLLLPLLPLSLWADSTFYISGTTDIEDCNVRSNNTTYNYGVTTSLYLGEYVNTYSILFRCPDLGNHIPSGWHVDTFQLEMYECGVYNTAGTTYVFPLVKPWHEGDCDGSNPTAGDDTGATYIEWRDTPGLALENKAWTTAGANDTGTTWNDNDGSGDDRWGTKVATEYFTTGWVKINIDTAQVNHYIATESENEGWIVQVKTGVQSLMGYFSSEYTTDTSKTLRVRMVIDSAVIDAGYLRNRHGGGNRHAGVNEVTRHGP